MEGRLGGKEFVSFAISVQYVTDARDVTRLRRVAANVSSGQTNPVVWAKTTTTRTAATRIMFLSRFLDLHLEAFKLSH